MSALLQSFGKQLAQCSGRFLPIHMDSDDADEVGEGGEGGGGGGDGGEDVKKKYPRGNYAYQRERQDDGRFLCGPTSGASAHTTNQAGSMYPGVMHKLSAPCASCVSGKVPPYKI